ncbi:MAG: stage II sporulation protein P [Clostridia bacterium]|nr:stage II sporulation protein P [Clostridia bacterium]
MTDFTVIDSSNTKEKERGKGPLVMANYYDLDEKVTVDLSGLFDGETGAENAAGNADAKSAAANKKEEGGAAGPDGKVAAGKKPDFFSGRKQRLADNAKRREIESEREEAERLADAEKKMDLLRQKQKKKSADAKKKEAESSEVWDLWLQKVEFLIAVGVLFAAFVLLIICTAVSVSKSSKGARLGGITEVHEGVKVSSDGTAIYGLLSGYRDFLAHDANVRAAAIESKTKNTPRPSDSTPAPEATPTAGQTDAPSETPTAAPSETPDSQGGTIVVSANENFYVFDIGVSGYKTVRLNSGDRYTSGILSDSAGELLVSAGGKDIEYGFLRIQNLYGAAGFELRNVLNSPLVVRRAEQGTTPVILYYSHTSGSYCLSADERVISKYPKIMSDDKARNVAGRGDVLKNACQKAGTGVYLISEKNDANAKAAYETAAAKVSAAASKIADAQFAVDLEVKTFEYPEGSRYSRTVAKDGKNYAMIGFVITQNDKTNPNWKENIKLAMYIIEKLEAEVPGISLGITLRSESKYNSSATKFGMIAELGYEGNLVTEADNSAELLGRVIGTIFAGK